MKKIGDCLDLNVLSDIFSEIFLKTSEKHVLVHTVLLLCILLYTRLTWGSFINNKRFSTGSCFLLIQETMLVFAKILETLKAEKLQTRSDVFTF